MNGEDKCINEHLVHQYLYRYNLLIKNPILKSQNVNNLIKRLKIIDKFNNEYNTRKN